MSPERTIRKQSGAGLPIATFIITVLALLVYGMAQLQESSGKSVSLQIQSQRAFFAAESGAQVAIAEVFQVNSCSGAEINFAEGALTGCQATISGCAVGDKISSDYGNFYQIKSVGVCGGGAKDEARRAVEVMLSVE